MFRRLASALEPRHVIEARFVAINSDPDASPEEVAAVCLDAIRLLAGRGDPDALWGLEAIRQDVPFSEVVDELTARFAARDA